MAPESYESFGDRAYVDVVHDSVCNYLTVLRHDNTPMAIEVPSNHARRGIKLPNYAQPGLSMLFAPHPTASSDQRANRIVILE